MVANVTLIACGLVVLDKIPGLRSMGIVKTLRWDLAKLIIRAAGYQSKMAWKNLQLFTGFEDGIKGETHAVGKRKTEKVVLEIIKKDAGTETDDKD